MQLEEYHIRDYRDEDFIEIERFWEENGVGGAFRGDDRKTILETIRNGGKLIIIEHKNPGLVIGTSWLTNDGRRIYLHHFAVRKEFRRKGLSKILLEKSLEFTREKGKQIKIEVHKDNHIAIDLYKKAGFRYLGDYDVYIMRKI
ncbi:MAG: GNAT family N-acetyltransferase [Bacteroidales bacterium]|nr:GNAT family N-acetyltransferase [Bacteroidales bacterium]